MRLADRWEGFSTVHHKWRPAPRPPGTLETVLVSLRDAGDPMADHELGCFALATGIPDIRVVHASSQSPGPRELDADLLLFGGSGAYSVLDPHPWVQHLLDFLLEVVNLGVPAWGSCFGYQGLALAMGGDVVRDDALTRMGGFPVELTDVARTDPLFSHLPTAFYAQFGHHDHVMSLPSGVTLLATDPGERLEAFRVDGSLFWAAQFHPELTAELTLNRFWHYAKHYAHDNQQSIADSIAKTPDFGEAQVVMPHLVKIAVKRRVERKG